ncbi:interleukin-4 receptor subunit alpha isoform X2 [Bufo bufo]|uniref:interleukin-4 receptor subunit alpha isoform X2 n=1 Tax=Bufo bufo TaxID=8384 RepID=UPI001ABE02C1|nr:interleukin-4 receptor subunit alpha isoform X2 [Bufo bufo]
MAASQVISEIIQISLIWITLTAPSRAQDIPKITNLDCLNDFDKKMVCFWEVMNGDTNCSSDFQLKYTDFMETTEYCRDINNEYNGNTRLPDKCICNIKVTAFIAEENYHIEVLSQGQSVGNTTVRVFSTVKPKPPSDLWVNLTDPENGVAHWKSNYESSFIAGMLSFHIQFISKEDDKTVEEHFLSQLEPQFTFSKRQLRRGHEYRVRVRTRHSKGQQRKEIWSKWSPEFVFRNDYDLTIMDFKWVIIPVICILVIVLSVFCYFCVLRTKEKWWNNIPDPARSKLAESQLIPKNHLKPTGKPSAGKSCKCLGKLAKALSKSKYEQVSKEYPAKDSLNFMGNFIFEPEKVDIESCIHLYPREDDNLHQEDSPEDDEEDIHLMPTDWSIGMMFDDILGKVETPEQVNADNAFGSFGTLILRDNFQKHLPISMVSHESGYQSYDSEDSPGDSKSYGPNPPYLDKSSLVQGDFLPYAPVPNINEGESQVAKDAFVNSGYNSFASALAEATSNIMERDNISVFSLGTFYQPNYRHSLQNPKSILYYNKTCFPTYEDDVRPIITPTSDYRVETCPISVSEGPGYQSFNQAVQQGDTSSIVSTTCLVFDSGYKPFESLTRISTSSVDNINSFSELDNQRPFEDSVNNYEDLQQTGMVNGGTDEWTDTQSSELNFFSRKYPSYSETLGDEHTGSVSLTMDIHYGIHRALKEADEPLALTFDIIDHMRNFANMPESSLSLGLEFCGFPTNITSFPCLLDETPIIHDHLLDKNCPCTEKDFSMKFENMSYFLPLHRLRAEDCSQTNNHLLVQHNNMDNEGNSYMKIAL